MLLLVILQNSEKLSTVRVLNDKLWRNEKSVTVGIKRSQVPPSALSHFATGALRSPVVPLTWSSAFFMLPEASNIPRQQIRLFVSCIHLSFLHFRPSIFPNKNLKAVWSEDWSSHNQIHVFVSTFFSQWPIWPSKPVTFPHDSRCVKAELPYANLLRHIKSVVPYTTHRYRVREYSTVCNRVLRYINHFYHI